MLSAIERGYWQPSDAVRARLQQENTRAIADAGVACSADSCSRATLRQAPQLAPPAVAQSAAPVSANATAPEPAAAPAAIPPKPAANPVKPVSPAKSNGQTAQVSGFEMQSLSAMTPAQKTIGSLALLALASALVGVGYWRRGARKM
jgi:cobaltochelatase CobN